MKNLTPMKSIRLKCLDCTCNQPREIRLCPIENCPLYPYRMGKRPEQGNYITNPSNNEKTTPTTAKTENLSI